MASSTIDLLAAWTPILAEPGDALSIVVTVPSGSETGSWTAKVWTDRRKITVAATFTVQVVGQDVTLSLTGAETAGLVPAGSSAFSGYWELDRTVSGTPRTWLKGDFVVDPARHTPR